MSAAWVTRNKEGVVNAAIVAQYANREDLLEWEKSGRTPELVDFGKGKGCSIGVPLPPDARIIPIE